MKKWLKISIAAVSLVSVASISAGTAALIYNANIKDKQKELSKITLLDKGNNISYNKDQKINYVVFGDSVSAGFSPYINDLSLNRTTLLNIRDNENKGSFNSYLKQGLNNLNLLNEYHDFSVSGLSSYEINNLNYDKVQAIKKANYISYEAGANDLLNTLIDSKSYTNQESIDNDYNKFQDIKNNKITDKQEIKEFLDSFISIKKDISSKDIIAIKESIGINILNFIKTVYDLNPNTSILLFGYHFPYQRWNSYFYNQKLLDLDYDFLEFFQEINNSIKTIANKYNFVSYLDIDSVLKQNKDQIDLILPNYYDIHFSSYFSLVLANKILNTELDKLFKENDLSSQEIKKEDLDLIEFNNSEDMNSFRSTIQQIKETNKNIYIQSYSSILKNDIDVAKLNRDKFKEIVSYDWSNLLK